MDLLDGAQELMGRKPLRSLGRFGLNYCQDDAASTRTPVQLRRKHAGRHQSERTARVSG
jgi:hypothetical protein